MLLDSSKYAVIIIRELLKNKRNEKVLYDLKCSNIVREEIEKVNGIPIEYRTGVSYTMVKVIEDKNNIWIRIFRTYFLQ